MTVSTQLSQGPLAPQRGSQDTSTGTALEGPTSPTASFNLIDYSPMISIILVIIGWRVIYNNAKKLATRTETKSLIDEVIKLTNELEGITIDYWLSGRKNRIESDLFTLLTSAKIETLTARLTLLKRRQINLKKKSLSYMVTYMDLDCEKVDSISIDKKREKVHLFLSYKNELIDELYTVYEEVYEPSFGLTPRLKRYINDKPQKSSAN